MNVELTRALVETRTLAQERGWDRVAEAADIGFDFIRLRVSLAPWTDTGSTADQQRG